MSRRTARSTGDGTNASWVSPGLAVRRQQEGRDSFADELHRDRGEQQAGNFGGRAQAIAPQQTSDQAGAAEKSPGQQQVYEEREQREQQAVAVDQDEQGG